MAINTYKTVHTGPKSHDGGAHGGLINCEYQLYVFIFFKFYQKSSSFSTHITPGLFCEAIGDRYSISLNCVVGYGPPAARGIDPAASE